MKITIPPPVRITLYLLTVLGAPVMAYLRARDIIGDLEMTFWAAEVSAVSLLAAFHVPVPEERDEDGQANTLLLIAVAALVLAVLAIAGFRL